MMERFVFIHGSSVGQSVFMPVDGVETIGNDIANKYFQGRTLRQKESSAKMALFVDLYKDSNGALYCIYSLVNNDCRGANGREGQYFALSIVCKSVYVYPEIVYKMLYSAYSQMFKANKILETNKEGEDQFVISQFKDEEEYLSVFIKQIRDVFDTISSGLYKTFDSSIHLADYDSWRGTKVCIEVCNSIETFDSLCEIGRLYISGEYESPSQKIKVLEGRIKSLEAEKAKFERHNAETKRFEKSKVRDEIEKLNLEIKQKDNEIESLSAENNGFKAAIEIVHNELDKYAKVGKAISNLQGKKSQYESKSKKDLLKICLLFIVLVLNILVGVMNYAFFRDLSSSLEKLQEKGEITGGGKQASSLDISPKELVFEAGGGEQHIQVSTDVEWECPNSPKDKDWLELQKKGNNDLLVLATSHDSTEGRQCTITLKAGNSEEKQISIIQKGKPVTAANEYTIIVQNSKGETLNQGDSVQIGEELSVVVTNPSLAASGFGWQYTNCSGKTNNYKQVKVKVERPRNKDDDVVVISYGDLNNDDKRTRFKLKLNPENEK